MRAPDGHRVSGISNLASSLVVALALFGCSSAGEQERENGGTVLSESGALSIRWECVSGDVPVRGRNRFELSIESTENDEPVEGLTLSMTPFMPAMGHGSSTVPAISEHGGGRYSVSDVVLAMPGRWELRTTISGSEPDYAVPRVEIE
jgi:hypothetical protein